MNKHVIKRNFSRNAHHYDDHAAVQKTCAEKVMDLIKGKKFSRILEVGCGTGMLTHLLSKRYDEANITAIDISDKMLSVAKKKVSGKNVCFKNADGEKYPLKDKHDLITSNATFQWFENFGPALGRFAGALTDKGALCFSMYGPKTFLEFEEVLGSHFGDRRRLSSGRFPSKDLVEHVLGEHFKKFKVKEEYFTVDFISLWNFLNDIKKTGARGYGLDDGIFLGKHRIRALEETYIKKFTGIIATHHVYFCKASL
jgi:malonyl-CoA O-methyltransferase